MHFTADAKKINMGIVKKRILIAPLDWGLGHATRCIPIINILLKLKCEVFIAAEGAVADLLKKEFPNLLLLPLKGYNIRYSRKRIFFFWKMITQIPLIKKTIKYENRWLEQMRHLHGLDIVISDNRFGLYNTGMHCIFLTHQLYIKTGNALTAYLAQKINYKYINRFNECWVADNLAGAGLAGILSHAKKLPGSRVSYTGILSRFKKKIVQTNCDLLILLSGPEPQRSIFENILIPQLKMLRIKTVVVRGLPGLTEMNEDAGKNITFYNHLPAAELNDLILGAKAIVARSGYSTIMDLTALQRRAVLVPTPGQTEQEYLASFLAEKRYFISAKQSDFNIVNALENLSKAVLLPLPETDENLLQSIINRLL